MAEFTPQQLDQLEDALEGLEDLDDLSALGLADPLRERLHDYQTVLRASREALPMEDVAPGLLDGVLAEARETRAAVADRPSAWKRWRAALIPVFALAGTTVVVLWIVKPGSPTVSEAEVPAETAGTQAPEAAAPAPSLQATPAATPAPGAADQQAPALEPEAAREATSADDDAKQAAKPSSAPRKGAGKLDAELPAQKPADEVLDKEGTWDLIEAGHRARRQGDCDGAERLYRRAEAAAYNTETRAAAWAGLGLCEEMRGEEDSKYLSDAKAADPGLATMIERERGSLRKAKPAPQKKSKMRMPDEAAQQDPFQGE